MGKIIVSENVSVDGVIEDATGDGDLGRGSWFTCITDQDREEWAKVEIAEAMRTEALLFGRLTYHWFVARGWATRTDAWASRLRSLPKYVVSSSPLEGPGWDNSTVLKGDLVEQVASLKHQVDGEIVVYGSGRLARTLIEHDLVDELRLMTYPLVVGAGDRLFGETTLVKPLRLVDNRTIGASLALLTYQPA
ncbi:deaminase [Kribbella capetownensis]|uniref:Deaminase n=1 Tax=Kribbella capetownensis TaxID=1572659 RepID=A0A4R0K510_9ACTN|nr:dihydrofolate reductase family protein [Kribbella capetownensis]TCC53006.1 deaminase [Kribbella capetownensis]